MMATDDRVTGRPFYIIKNEFYDDARDKIPVGKLLYICPPRGEAVEKMFDYENRGGYNDLVCG